MSRSDIDDSEEEAQPDPDDQWVAECLCGMLTSSKQSARHQRGQGMKLPTFACDTCGSWSHIHCYHRFLSTIAQPEDEDDDKKMYCFKCEPVSAPWQLCSVRTWRLILKMLTRESRSRCALVSRQWRQMVLWTAVRPRIVSRNPDIALYMAQRVGTRDLTLNVLDQHVAEQLEVHLVNDLQLTGVGDSALSLIPEHIRKLTVCDSRVTDAGLLVALKNIPKLRYLDVSGCSVSGSFSKGLPNSLLSLTAVGADLNADNMKSLAALPHLKHLDLSHNANLSEDIVRHVPSSIETLNLSYTGAETSAFSSEVVTSWNSLSVLVLSAPSQESLLLDKLKSEVRVEALVVVV